MSYPFGKSSLCDLERYSKGEPAHRNCFVEEGEESSAREFPLPNLGAEGVETWRDGSAHPIRIVRHFSEWHDTGERFKNYRCHLITEAVYLSGPYAGRRLFLWGDRWSRVRIGA